jgi:hypothetical protein
MRGFKYYVKTSSFKDVPLFIFFKALGIESEQVINYENLLFKGDHITNWDRGLYYGQFNLKFGRY